MQEEQKFIIKISVKDVTCVNRYETIRQIPLDNKKSLSFVTEKGPYSKIMFIKLVSLPEFCLKVTIDVCTILVISYL